MRASHIRSRFLATAAMAALAAAITGCALNPPPTTSDLQKEALPHTSVPVAWTAGGGGGAAPVADRWLASFDDPALSALVDEALAYNADLQAAAARVEQAAGYVKVANASLLPSVGVFAWAAASRAAAAVSTVSF